MGLMTKLEDILGMVMESLPHRLDRFHPVDLVRMSLRSMEQGSRQGINRIYAPNRFTVLLHPDDYQENVPLLDVIQNEIITALTDAVQKRGYLLPGELAVRIREDAQVRPGHPVVRGRMSGRDEPDSVVEYEQAAPKQPEEQQDGGGAGTGEEATVIAAEPETIIEEGLTMIRDGNPGQAAVLLAEIEEDAADLPHYQAAMGVCQKMLGREEQAEEHFSRLRELRPDLVLPPPVRLALDAPSAAGDQPENRDEKKAEKNDSGMQENETGCRLVTNIAGVAVLFRDNRLILENRYLNPAASVDGRVEESMEVKPGCEMVLGTVRLHVANLTQGEEAS